MCNSSRWGVRASDEPNYFLDIYEYAGSMERVGVGIYIYIYMQNGSSNQYHFFNYLF